MQVEYDPIETFWYIKNVFYAEGGFYGVIPSPSSLTTHSPHGANLQLSPKLGVIPTGGKKDGSAGREGRMEKRISSEKKKLFQLMKKKEEILDVMKKKWPGYFGEDGNYTENADEFDCLLSELTEIQKGIEKLDTPPLAIIYERFIRRQRDGLFKNLSTDEECLTTILPRSIITL